MTHFILSYNLTCVSVYVYILQGHAVNYFVCVCVENDVENRKVTACK